MFKTLFNYLIFPGFLFSAFIGLMASWVDRKVSARLQWRLGPPWYQSFIDIVKLMHKEIIVPQGTSAAFLLAPYLGLLSIALVSVILGMNIGMVFENFVGDIIVVLYLLVIPAISIIIGASASRNPLASVGASREMKLVLGYELPFILAVIAIIIKSGGAIQFSSIINHQAGLGSNIASLSGILAFISAILCMQAKLCFVPFTAGHL
jgi:NADH-quinone oxidoreductase subunit H